MPVPPEAEDTAAAARHRRKRAFTLGVANGALFEVVISTMQPGLVLSAFLLKLTDSTFYASLPLALMHLGALWPQLIVAHIAEGMPYKKPIYVWSGIARISMLVLMATTTALWPTDADHGLALLFLGLYFLYASANGAGGIGFMEMVAKTVPTTRRGRFMGMRGFFGGLCGLATGFYVRHMLGAGGPTFPGNYALLFATASAFLVAAVVVYAAVPEPPSDLRRNRGSFASHLRRGWDTLGQDRNYRLLVWTRLALAASMAGQVLFIPYAIKELHLPESIVGVLMVIAAVFSLPSNFLWSHLSDRHGNRRLLLVAATAFCLVPACAVASYHAPADGPLTTAGYGPNALLFIAAFMLGAVATRGGFMGSTNYLLEIAPEERRPSYMAFMRVLQAPTVLMPLVGGTVAEWISFQAAFLLSGLAALATLALVLRLDEPRRAS